MKKSPTYNPSPKFEIVDNEHGRPLEIWHDEVNQCPVVGEPIPACIAVIDPDDKLDDEGKTNLAKFVCSALNTVAQQTHHLE